MSQVEIYNQALGLIGVGRRLTSPNSNAREAEECNLFYDRVRRMILTAAWWPSSKRTARLSASVERDTSASWVDGDPHPKYLYAYNLPQGYLYPRMLVTGEVFEIALLDDTTPMLMSNAVSPILEYTYDQEDDTNWTPLQFQATAALLAAFIAPGLTGKRGTVQQVFQLASDLVLQARVQAGNLEDIRTDSAPPWITVRGVSAAPVSRYVYSFSDLVSPVMT